jgi:hypothetical protein
MAVHGRSAGLCCFRLMPILERTVVAKLKLYYGYDAEGRQ